MYCNSTFISKLEVKCDLYVKYLLHPNIKKLDGQGHFKQYRIIDLHSKENFGQSNRIFFPQIQDISHYAFSILYSGI